MKIGIDIREAQGNPAGKGMYVRELIKSLALIDQENEYVLYARIGDKLSFELPANMHVEVVSAPSLFWHVAVAWQMRFRDRVDIFLASTSYIIPFLVPRRCIVIVYDVYALIAPETHLKRVFFS